MSKSRIKKDAWSHVRLRPVAKRFYGADGPQLPPVDDDWLIQGVEDAGARISNNHTGHGTLLAWVQIHHYATDPDRSDRNGFLIPEHAGQHRREFFVVRAFFQPR